jgi:hypothetical protein
MNSTVTKIFFLLILVSTAFAGAYLDYFHARTESENVKLEWKTGNEDNLRSFVIERKTPQSSFIEITTIQPKGNNSYYSYIDESAYKANDLIFIYRLKIVDNNNQYSYSSEVSVIPSLSDVKRTWGSIKAMFR